MPVRVQLPDLEHWKAQVKCQSGCPVRTDAGRYVQLIAEGRHEEAYLVARAPNPFASVCGRVCAAPCEDACRRGSIDAPIAIRALKRYVTEQYGVESRRPDTQDRLRETPDPGGQPSIAGTFRSCRWTTGARGAAPEGGRGRSGAGRDVGGSRPRAARLRRDRLRRRRRAGRDDALRHPRVPAAARRSSTTRSRRSSRSASRCGPASRLTPSFGLARAARGGLPLGVPLGRACPGDATCSVPGVELDGVVKAVDYLLNVNRGYRMDLGRRVVVIGGGFVAFDAARTALRARPRGGGARAGGRDRRAHEGGLRLGARGPARRRHRGHDRLPRELRRDAGAADDAGARGVRGGEARRRRVPAAARAEAVPGRRAPAAGRAARRALGVRRDRPLRAPLRRRRRAHAGGRRLRARHRPEGRPRRS